MSPQNVVVTPAKSGKGPAKVALRFGSETVPIKDQGTADEIQRRIKDGDSLEDSSYWLKSHGATTLEGRHVVEAQDGVHLRFVGKEGVWHDHLVQNPELAAMLLERKATSHQRGGKLFGVNDSKAAAYVKTLDHGRLSPKDFRTNRANEIAAAEVRTFDDLPPPTNEKEAKARKIRLAVVVSRKLGNQPQQAIDSYIDPAVWNHPAFGGIV
jgi:DNA topoisomerase IB